MNVLSHGWMHWDHVWTDLLSSDVLTETSRSHPLYLCVCRAMYVVQCMWCSVCRVMHVMQCMSCDACHAVYVVRCMSFDIHTQATNLMTLLAKKGTNQRFPVRNVEGSRQSCVGTAASATQRTSHCRHQALFHLGDRQAHGNNEDEVPGYPLRRWRSSTVGHTSVRWVFCFATVVVYILNCTVTVCASPVPLCGVWVP